MRILIVGAGAVGFYLARRLAEESHEVTIIDPDPGRVQRAADNLDVLAIKGNGAAAPDLERAGLVDAEILMAVSASDEVNLVACLVASKRGVPVTVARISHPEYHSPKSILSREDLGVDLMIGPEQECAWEAFGLLTTSAATDLARFAGGRIQLVGMRVLPGAPVAGKPLSELDREVEDIEFVISAVVRDGVTEIPTGATVVEPGDKIFVVGPSRGIRKLPTLAGHEPLQLRRVMIGGGSDEAVYLARHLLDHGVHCTILELNRERCRELSEQVPAALVLHGDTTDLDLLEMEGIEGIDGFVALTNRDEVNMLAALLAKTCGARRSIPLIHKMEYMSLVERVGLDAAISPRISAANAILRYVRRGPIASVATLKGSEAEAMETVVSSSARLVNRPLREVRFPAGSLLGGIVRGEEVIMPRGGDVLLEGDHAIFFVLPEAIAGVEKLLA
jgi:trk system potassium uptake protein TrkA